MKVLHLVSQHARDNGYSLRTQRLVDAQRKAGIDAEIVAPESLDPGVHPQQLEDLGLVLRTMNHWMDGAFCLSEDVRAHHNEIMTACELIDEADIRRADVDLIHAHTPWPCAIVASLIAERLGVPWVFEARGLQEDSAAANGKDWPRAKYDAWKQLCSRARREADHVFAISPALVVDAIERGAGNVTLTPNAVDCDEFRPLTKERRREVRAQHGLGDGPIVGYVGSIRPLEGIDELIRALPLLRDRFPGIRMLLVGGGDWPGLMVLASELGVSDMLDYRGAIAPDCVPELLAAVDCVAITRPDTHVTRTVTPLKPLEALACGVPVVSSDLPALRFVGERGTFFYPPGDLERLAERVFGAIYCGQEFGLEGRTWVEKERTWESVAASQIEVYKGLRR